MNKTESRYPPAPELHGDLLLDVFTHKSLRQEGGGGVDNERYAVLGEKVLEAGIMHSIFLTHPKWGRQEIEKCTAELLTDETYELWINHYRFRDKLRFNNSALADVHSPQGARELFHAYVGGVYVQANGPLTANTWVYRLVVSPQDRIKLQEATPSYHSPQPPPPTHPYSMPPPPPPQSNMYPSRNRTNSTASMNTPMAIHGSSDSLPLTTLSGGKPVYLPRFNEITTQLKYNVHYPAEQTGVQHAPRWVVKCVVNGNEMGMGAATTKQLAKEEAARQAFLAMNFTLS